MRHTPIHSPCLPVHCCWRLSPSCFYPSLTHFCFGLSVCLSLCLPLSKPVSTSNSNSNSNSFIGMTRESLPWAHSLRLPLLNATRPGPVTSDPAQSEACVMLRRGGWALCVGSDLWTASLWARQCCVGVRDSSDSVSLFALTHTTTVLWSWSAWGRGCEMCACPQNTKACLKSKSLDLWVYAFLSVYVYMSNQKVFCVSAFLRRIF